MALTLTPILTKRQIKIEINVCLPSALSDSPSPQQSPLQNAKTKREREKQTEREREGERRWCAVEDRKRGRENSSRERREKGRRKKEEILATVEFQGMTRGRMPLVHNFKFHFWNFSLMLMLQYWLGSVCVWESLCCPTVTLTAVKDVDHSR